MQQLKLKLTHSTMCSLKQLCSTHALPLSDDLFANCLCFLCRTYSTVLNSQIIYFTTSLNKITFQSWLPQADQTRHRCSQQQPSATCHHSEYFSAVTYHCNTTCVLSCFNKKSVSQTVTYDVIRINSSTYTLTYKLMLADYVMLPTQRHI